MSFPKAKILRFNDLTSCAPAPGSYDPKFNSKVKGAVIQKSERFGESKSSSDIEKSPCANLPVFRTPQPPRRLLKSKSTRSLQCQEKQVNATDTENSDFLSNCGDGNFGKSQSVYSDSCFIKNSAEKLEECLNDLKECRRKCLSLEVDVSELEHEKNNLLTDIEKYKVEIFELKSTFESSVKSNEEYCSKLSSELEELQKKYNEEKSMFELTLKTAEDNNKLLEDKNNILNEKLFMLESEFDSHKLLWESEIVKHKASNSDLENKLSQKQQMILLLQSDLSSAEVEFVECRAEVEKLVVEHNLEKSALTFEFSQKIDALNTEIEKISLEKEEQKLEISKLHEKCESSESEVELISDTLKIKEEELETLKLECKTLANERQAAQLLHQKDTEIFFENLRICKDMVEKQGSIIFEANLQRVDKALLNYENRVHTLFKDKLNALNSTWQTKVKGIQVNNNGLVEDLNKKISQVTKDKQGADELIGSLKDQLKLVSAKLTSLEAELRNISLMRDEFRVSDMENKLVIVELQDKLDSLTLEHNQVSMLLAKVRLDLETTEDQKRKLEVGNRNLRDSLDALSSRLLESEHDVDRLTVENKELLDNKTKLLTEIESYKNELKMQEEALVKLENENLAKIEEVRKVLLSKVESYKEAATKQAQSMHNLQSEVDSLSGNMHSFSAQLECVSKYVEELEEEIESKDKKLQALTKEADNVSEIRAAVESELESNKSQILDLTNTLSQVEAERDTLSEKLDHQRSCGQQQIEQLSEEIESYSEFCQNASQHIMALTNANAEIRSRLDSVLLENADLKRDVEAKEGEITDMSIQLKCALAKQKQYESEAESLSIEKDALLEDLDLQKKCGEDYVRKIATLEINIIDSQRNVENLKRKISSLENEVIDNEQIVKDLKFEMDEYREKYNEEEFVKLINRNIELESIKTDLELEVHELTREISRLEEDIAENEEGLAASTTELQRHKMRAEEFETILSDKQCLIETLQNEKVEYQSHIKSLEDSLNEKSRKLEENFEMLEGDLIVLKTVNEDLKETNRSMGKRHEDLMKRVNELESIITELKAKEEILQSQLQETETALERANLKSSSLDALIGPFRDQLEKFLAEKKDLESRKVAVEEDYRNLALQYAQILGHQNHKQKIKHMVQLKEKNIELKEEVEKLKSHNRAQKRTIEKLKDDLAHFCKSSRKPTINKENVDQTNLPLDPTPLHIPLKNKENSAAICSARKVLENADSSPIRQVLKSKENSPVVHHHNVKSPSTKSFRIAP